MRRLLLSALILLLPGIALAQSQGIQQLNQWKTNGQLYLQPINAAYGLLIPGLATSTTGCLSVATGGWISASGSACGSGAGSVYPFFLAGNATSTLTGFLGGLVSSASTTIAASTTVTGVLTASGGIYGALTGNASTATALAANGTNCSAGSYALGVDASGNAEGCTVANLGTVTAVTGSWPIVSSGGTTPNITWNGLATSSPIAAASGLLYATGVNTFASVSTSSAITMSITGNAGTVTNGVYTTTFDNLFDIRLSATTTLPNITTLAGLTTVSTSLTGLLKASSGVLSAASNGTDFTLITAKTCTVGDFVSAVTAAGVFTCTTPTGTGGVWPFLTTETNYGVAVQSTTTPEWFHNGLMASTTSHIDYASTTAVSAGGGSVGAPSITVGGDNSRVGIYLNGANILGFASSGAGMSWSGSALYPNTSDLRNLGIASTNQWLHSYIDFASSTSLSTTNGVVLASAGGNVGIGTTTPNWQLSLSKSTGAQLHLGSGAGGTGWLLQQYPSGSLFFATTSSLTLSSSTIAAFTITPNGYVGIGSTTPSSQFSIAGVLDAGINGAVWLYKELVGVDKTTSDVGQISPDWHISFKIATTTLWTGTSTTASPYADTAVVYSPYAGTVKRLICGTDAGNLTVELTDGSSHTYLVASTTANWNILSPTLTLARGDKLVIQAGNPSSSPTSTPCSIEGVTTP
jgi:hypothetical protein